MRNVAAWLALIAIVGWLKPKADVEPKIEIDFPKILENLDRTAAEQAKIIDNWKRLSHGASESMKMDRISPSK